MIESRDLVRFMIAVERGDVVAAKAIATVIIQRNLKEIERLTKKACA